MALPLKDFRWDNDFAGDLETFFAGRSNDYNRGVETQVGILILGLVRRVRGTI